MKKRWIAVLSAIVCLIGAVSVLANPESGSSPETAGSSNASISGKINLSFDAQSGFTATDPYGCQWSSFVPESNYDFSMLNESWQQNFRSFLTVYYADISDVNPAIKTSFSSEASLTAVQDRDQLSVTASYPCGITITVLAKAVDGRLQFTIPSDQIRETGKFKLISVDFMPYMGAASSKEKGFMLYPDGCGALTYFRSGASEAIKNQTYTWDVYGADLSSLDTLAQQENDEIRSAMLPMFGISGSNGGLICFSEEGEAESKINMTPANSGIGLNRIYFSFQYRTAYQIAMSNIDINGTSTAKDINGKMISAERLERDHTVSYCFLDREHAGYSDMANAYRKYLQESGRLHQSTYQDEYTLSVKLLMSAAQESLFHSSLAVATDYAQAKTIMDYFDDSDCPHIFYTLSGWSNGGADCYPQSDRWASSLGSKKELMTLLESGKASLAFNGFRAESGQSGFSTGKDVVKDGNQNAVTNAQEDRFLLNSSYFTKKWQTLLKEYATPNGTAFSLDDVGKLCYRDAAQSNPMDRESMKSLIEEQLRVFAKSGKISVEGANAYCLPYADAIYGLEDDSSEYYISDETVPLVQMVLHGSIPYTGKAGNLSPDFQKCLLKWIEYGYSPYFELTYQNADVLKNTSQSTLFTSRYENHADSVKRAYQAYEELAVLQDRAMIRHESFSKTLKAVTYEGNITVYCNYADQTAQLDGLEIPAGSYLVKEGAE
ncbi:MAG: hypothetical protein IJT66_06940 [Clostridia bacterium]|nr:hypothetical protein [Clostridia bacterium]